MTHYVDSKGRTDNIWNITIIPLKESGILEIKDIRLVINLIYSVSKKYNYNTDKVLEIYRELLAIN